MKIKMSDLKRQVKEAVQTRLGTAKTPKKLKASELKEFVGKNVRKALFEAADKESSGKLGKYAEDVDGMVSETIDKIDGLLAEGEELLSNETTLTAAAHEANTIVMGRLGMLKGLKARLAQMLEELRRSL